MCGQHQMYERCSLPSHFRSPWPSTSWPASQHVRLHAGEWKGTRKKYALEHHLCKETRKDKEKEDKRIFPAKRQERTIKNNSKKHFLCEEKKRNIFVLRTNWMEYFLCAKNEMNFAHVCKQQKETFFCRRQMKINISYATRPKKGTLFLTKKDIKEHFPCKKTMKRNNCVYKMTRSGKMLLPSLASTRVHVYECKG